MHDLLRMHERICRAIRKGYGEDLSEPELTKLANGLNILSISDLNSIIYGVRKHSSQFKRESPPIEEPLLGVCLMVREYRSRNST